MDFHLDQPLLAFVSWRGTVEGSNFSHPTFLDSWFPGLSNDNGSIRLCSLAILSIPSVMDLFGNPRQGKYRVLNDVGGKLPRKKRQERAGKKKGQ